VDIEVAGGRTPGPLGRGSPDGIGYSMLRSISILASVTTVAIAPTAAHREEQDPDDADTAENSMRRLLLRWRS